MVNGVPSTECYLLLAADGHVDLNRGQPPAGANGNVIGPFDGGWFDVLQQYKTFLSPEDGTPAGFHHRFNEVLGGLEGR